MAYEERTGIRRRFEKRSAEICNIHRLWKLLGPVVIRRRKDYAECRIMPYWVPVTLGERVFDAA